MQVSKIRAAWIIVADYSNLSINIIQFSNIEPKNKLPDLYIPDLPLPKYQSVH